MSGSSLSMLLLKEVRKSAWTAIAKYHRLGSLINRNVIFQLRSRKFENKVSAELISSQASLLALEMGISSYLYI